MAASHSGSWLLVTVSTAGAPAALRVHAWRKLRSLGALYLQQSVCLLPARATPVEAVAGLVERVERDGGSARILSVRFDDPAEEAGLVAALNAARDDEYDEVLERVPELLGELVRETARGRVTFAEVEESEADLERFRSWLARIERRDYFTASKAADARAAVEGCAEALERFEAEAVAREAPEPVDVAVPARPIRHLRAT